MLGLDVECPGVVRGLVPEAFLLQAGGLLLEEPSLQVITH